MNNKYIKLHDGQKWNLRDREESVEDSPTRIFKEQDTPYFSAGTMSHV